MTDLTTPPKPPAPEMPANVKELAWWWYQAKANWEVLRKPPLLVLAVACCVVGYWYGSSKESGLLDLKNERIKFLGDQLTAYKDRLQGATPDEAAKQIAELRAKLAFDEDRLSVFFPDKNRTIEPKVREFLASQKQKLLEDVKTLSIFAFSLGDSLYYAKDFYDLFKEIGVAVQSVQPSNCNLGETGVLVGLTRPDVPSEQAKDFLDILTKAGLTPRYTKWYSGDGFAPVQDFDLFVCPDRPMNPVAAPMQAPLPTRSEAK